MDKDKTLEIMQGMKGATIRKAIIEGLLKKMNALDEMAALSLTREERVYLRDLVGNQWGREDESVRIAAEMFRGQMTVV
jgi:hypothetical protein